MVLWTISKKKISKRVDKRKDGLRRMSRTGAQLKAQIVGEPQHYITRDSLSYPLTDDATVYTASIYQIRLYFQDGTKRDVHREKLKALARKIKNDVSNVANVKSIRVYFKYEGPDWEEDRQTGAFVDFYADYSRAQILSFLSAQGITVNDLTYQQIIDKIEQNRMKA